MSATSRKVSDLEWMDFIDLEEWIAGRFPEVLSATRYLPLPAQMECWTKIFKQNVAQ